MFKPDSYYMAELKRTRKGKYRFLPDLGRRLP